MHLTDEEKRMLAEEERHSHQEGSGQAIGIKEERISDFVEFDLANAIKFTIYRTEPSGSPGDPDVLGTQQYIPLLDIKVPVE